MSLDPRTLTAALALGVAVLALALWFVRGRGSRRARRRAKRAVKGEARAAALLEAEGFEVIDSQLAGEAVVEVDGHRHRFEVRADYLVRRGGRKWVAEVKTGDVVTRLAHGATRRQLMEYTLAFEADGILLVTPEDGHIREVSFPALGSGALWPRLAWFTLGCAVGALGHLFWAGG